MSNGNGNFYSNNVMWIITRQKSHVLFVILSAKDDQRLSNFLAKSFKDLYIGMNIKHKLIIKLKSTSRDISRKK